MATTRRFSECGRAEHGLTGARCHSRKSSRRRSKIHRADVFYNLDATGWGADFVKEFPAGLRQSGDRLGTPRRFENVTFSDYDLVVCNFPSILAAIRAQGCRLGIFFSSV